MKNKKSNTVSKKLKLKTLFKKTSHPFLIVISATLVLCSLALISYIGTTQIKKSNQEFANIIQEQNRQTTLVTGMRNAARERMMELWRMTLTVDSFEQNDSYENFLDHATSYLISRDQFLQTKLTDVERELYRELKEAARKSSTYHRNMADKLMRDQSLSADEILNNTLPSHSHTLKALNRLIDHQAVENEHAFTQATHEVENTVSLMIILTASSIFIGALLATIVHRNDIKMRKQLQLANEKLIKSNQNLESRVKERTWQLQYANSRLQHQAHYDNLTGLANRALLTEQMAILLNQSKREHKKLAVLFMDIDGFKPINDEYGHDMGDQMLRVFAERITSTVRNSDLAARFGGDEFVIVLPDVKSQENVEEFAMMLAKVLSEPMKIDELDLKVGTSIGISLFPDHAAFADDLIKNADIAMYFAKRDKFLQFKIYETVLQDQDSSVPETLQS